ncbi:MAG: hypothetical protein JST91_06930 [Actinobacteria bacterium]|nr:hypothetical protein [Actinomycetota bacterium]
MKKLIVLGSGIVAASASMALFGSGVAVAAPDVVGQTYADASSAISDSGGSAVVATTVGGRLPQDECIVTNAWSGSFVRDVGGEFGHSGGEVMLALNCNGDHATATSAGPSVASPEGREAKAAADQAKAAEEQELQAVSTPDE